MVKKEIGGLADGPSSSQLLVLLSDLETSGVSHLSLTSMEVLATSQFPIFFAYSSWESLFFSWSSDLVKNSKEVMFLCSEVSTNNLLELVLLPYSRPISSPSITLSSSHGLVFMLFTLSAILFLGTLHKNLAPSQMLRILTKLRLCLLTLTNHTPTDVWFNSSIPPQTLLRSTLMLLLPVVLENSSTLML